MKTIAQQKKSENEKTNNEDEKEELKIPNKKEQERPMLEDAYVFIQCENSSYIIEKSLGSNEKMLVSILVLIS